MLIKRKYNTNINESTSDGFVIDETGVLIKYKGKDNNVVIPDGVISIGYNAFGYCKNLKSITIPDSVESICGWAFQKCVNLENIKMYNDIKYIGKYAFFECYNLKNIVTLNNSRYGIKERNRQDSVPYIGEGAFSDCVSLESVIIPDGIEYIDDYTFRGCSTLKSITIPNSVKSISDYAFDFCENLESVKIANGVNSIGSYAFKKCSNLKSINIPNSVAYMRDNVFLGCENLTTINMPNPIKMTADTLYGTHITKFNGVDISDKDDLHFIELDNELTLILPDEEYVHCDNINGEECYIKYIESNYNKFIVAVYPDMKREVFDMNFNSLTDGIRLVDILDIYDEYPVGVREDGKQTFICWGDDDFLYKGQWFDECYTDMKGNMYIDGKKVN